MNDNTLNKNAIKKFLLRIDIIKNDALKYLYIVQELSKYVDRVESRQASNFSINFTQPDPEIKTSQVFDYVLTSDSKGYFITISEIQNAIYFESSSYTDNSTYKDFIELLINIINVNAPETLSKRIGLRYINEFSCDSTRSVSSVFGKRLSSALKNMMSRDNQSRVIGVEEYNNQDTKARIQFGIPNKHYPSTITRIDLLLDIDYYYNSSAKLIEWDSIIKNLNHAAYAYFSSEINPKIIEKLK